MKELHLTKRQVRDVEQIRINQEFIDAACASSILIAADSGDRLIKLKDEIQKVYGRTWKVWVQTENNLSIGYEQATRYMKLASNRSMLTTITANSIEDAVKQIGRKLNPEKAEAATAAREEKKAEQKAQAGIGCHISEAVLNEIDDCTYPEELRGIIALCTDRLEVIEEAKSRMNSTWNGASVAL